jgi:hypothetical protein
MKGRGGDVHVVSNTQGGVHGDVYPKRVFVSGRVGSGHVDDGVAVGERSVFLKLVCERMTASREETYTPIRKKSTSDFLDKW